MPKDPWSPEQYDRYRKERLFTFKRILLWAER